jgi:hypothetical protein
MVMGLAPVFLLQRFVRFSPRSFHFSFWPGVVLGLLLTAKLIPHAWPSAPESTLCYSAPTPTGC